MSYRPIGKKKILESLFETYCSYEANNQDEEAKGLAHLNVQLQGFFDLHRLNSISVGGLIAQAFSIGRDYQKSIDSDIKRTQL